eukprot:15012030-Ditylum_brightwellii.AAC.1
MEQVEKYGHLDDAQYGGRKGREAIEPAVMKLFTIEICHLQRSNAAFTDCDAKACYNRIIPAVSALLETEAGCPTEVSTTLARTLEKLEYHPTTAKSVSVLTSKHTEETLGYRTGLGVKDSPGKLTLTDNNIITCYKKLMIVLLMEDPMGTIHSKRALIKFVDDATLFHNLEKKFNLDPENMMNIGGG